MAVEVATARSVATGMDGVGIGVMWIPWAGPTEVVHDRDLVVVVGKTDSMGVSNGQPVVVVNAFEMTLHAASDCPETVLGRNIGTGQGQPGSSVPDGWCVLVVNGGASMIFGVSVAAELAEKVSHGMNVT